MRSARDRDEEGIGTKQTFVRPGISILFGWFLISAPAAWSASAPNPFLPPELSACARQFPVTGVVPPNAQPDPAPEDLRGILDVSDGGCE